MKEKNIQSEIMLALSEQGNLVWRNNTGMGWAGRANRITMPGSVRVEPGDVVIRNARPLHAGLCVGSCDLIGITPVRVTRDMVGTTLGVFTAHEIKSKQGRLTDEQKNFIYAVTRYGGMAGVARSPEDALSLIGKTE